VAWGKYTELELLAAGENIEDLQFLIGFGALIQQSGNGRTHFKL